MAGSASGASGVSSQPHPEVSFLREAVLLPAAPRPAGLRLAAPHHRNQLHRPKCSEASPSHSYDPSVSLQPPQLPERCPEHLNRYRRMGVSVLGTTRLLVDLPRSPASCCRGRKARAVPPCLLWSLAAGTSDSTACKRATRGVRCCQSAPGIHYLKSRRNWRLQSFSTL